MKKLMILCVALSAMVGVEAKSKKPAKVNQQEYNQLMDQCRVIRDQVVQTVKAGIEDHNQQAKAAAVRDYNAAAQSTWNQYSEGLRVENPFATSGEYRRLMSGINQVERNVATQQAVFWNANYTAVLEATAMEVVKQVTAYLQSVGTPTAMAVLNDIQRANFNF